MRLRILASLALVALAFGGCDRASPTDASACTAQLHASAEPEIGESLKSKARRICRSGFSLVHSGLSRTPIWVAERLTAERVRGAQGLERNNSFHVEDSLPSSERAELSDYARSGFDRGHMAPNGDMDSPESQNESFTLANMVPQDSDMNRRLWRDIEMTVRDVALRNGEAFVVTGPAFIGSELRSLKGRVLVPTHIYKAVYVPSLEAAAVFWAPNQPQAGYEIISLAELENRTGIRAFPTLTGEVVTNAGLDPKVGKKGRRK